MGAESAPKNEAYMGGKKMPRVGTSPYYGMARAPNPKSASDTSRGLNPPTEATVGVQGPSNPVSYVRIPPPATEQGQVRASRVMASTTNHAFNGAIHSDPPKAKSRNTNAQPASSSFAYGPGKAGNSAVPEAAAFGVGGGAPVRLRTPAKRGNTASGKV
jgi:hypothetical protein